jgi:hypothetical protein
MSMTQAAGESELRPLQGAGVYSSSMARSRPGPPIVSRSPPSAADDDPAANAALTVLARLLGRQAARQHGRRPGHSNLRIAAVLMAVSVAVALTLLMLRVLRGY